jgi:hypothetical protein
MNWNRKRQSAARNAKPLLLSLCGLGLLLLESGTAQAGFGDMRIDPGMATGIFSILAVSAMLFSDRILRRR